MKGYEARILEGPDTFALNIVRLALRDGYTHAVLMSDGTWHTPAEGTIPVDHGLQLPAGSIDAIATAIEHWQGRANHGVTEARILREWLAAERARVDAVLSR